MCKVRELCSQGSLRSPLTHALGFKVSVVKLVGSKTEREIRLELIKSTSSVFSEYSESHVKTYFLDNDMDFSKVIVLSSFPDDRVICYCPLMGCYNYK